jgi:hypothetical protein
MPPKAYPDRTRPRGGGDGGGHHGHGGDRGGDRGGRGFDGTGGGRGRPVEAPYK